MKRLPETLGGQRKWLLARLIGNGVIQAGIMLATAWLVKMAFDLFVATSTPAPAMNLTGYGIGLIATAITFALLRMQERVDAERLGQSYTHDIRIGLFSHMSKLEPRVLQQRSRGAILLRFIGDLNALKQWVSLGLARLIVAGVTACITLSALALVNQWLALLVGIILLVGLAATLVLGQWLQRTVREARRHRVRLAANVGEKISSLAVMQIYGQTRREGRRVKRQSQRLCTAMVTRAHAVGTLRAIVELTTALASGGILLLGALLVSAGQITAGVVVAAMTIVGLLVPALRDLGRVQEYWHGAVVSREKICDFLALPSLMSVPRRMCKLSDGDPLGHIEFDEVSVTGIIHKFSGVAEAGKKIAIVGPNGAGKSTLLALATRLVEANHGNIYIDGQNLTNINSESLRQEIGLMSSDLPLLRGSVDKNLRYRWPDASEEELTRVRSLCGIDQLIEELPQGKLTRLSENGNNLSLGQRQRLSLARAMLGNPCVLLLDEMDANLDPQSSAALRRVLTEYQGTVLFVTHRLDWAAKADIIWYVQAGTLKEVGTPAQLLKGNGPTARLFPRPQIVAVQ